MKKLLIIGGAVAALVVASVLAAFFISPMFASANNTSNATTTATTYCAQYEQNLAKRLNVSVSVLEQDKQAAFADVLSQEVKDGKLTQAQANAIQQRIASHPASGCAEAKLAGTTTMAGQFLKQYKADIMSQVAQGLSLTPAQLKAQLQSGKSLSDVATAQHVSATQLHTLVTNAVQNDLTKAVSAGTMTQEQANAFSQMLQSHPQFLNRLLNAKHVAR